MLSRRVQRIAPSPTLAISSLAREMRASGLDVLDFSAGQPDFPTPEAVKRAGIRAIEQNRTRYTDNAGLGELRNAIASRIHADHGIDYGADEILVSPGAKASLYFACLALLDAGDDVLLPAPYWVSYPEQIRLAGAEPVVVECGERHGFKVDLERLAAARTARTRLLVLNYPSNPTGATYTREELEPLAEFCVRHGIWILADEIYSRLIYDGLRHQCIAALGPEVRERTVVIDGMSKTYAMTGWRVGYAAAPKKVIQGMARLQSHVTSNATSISQWASLEALTSDDAEIRERVAQFQQRRDEMLARLEGLAGVRCTRPAGAFYAFPNVEGCLVRSAQVGTPEALARYLLERARVALVPGEGFGSHRHVRLSYAVSIERIREGMSRIEEALEELGKA